MILVAKCFLRFYVFNFRERGRGGEGEGGKHSCVVASHMTLLGTTWLPRYVP